MIISNKDLVRIIREELNISGGGRPEMNRRTSTSWRGWTGGVTEGEDDDTPEIGDDERSAMGGEEEVTLESIDSDAFVKMILAELSWDSLSRK